MTSVEENHGTAEAPLATLEDEPDTRTGVSLFIERVVNFGNKLVAPAVTEHYLGPRVLPEPEERWNSPARGSDRYHLYGDSAQGTHEPFDPEAAKQRAYEVLEAYFESRSPEDA